MYIIRTRIGMCPQHNVLFERLTVEEHLIFYGLLRGRTAEEVRAESVEMLKSLDLEKKRHSLAHTLSGGMKRKLSIATAFVGQAKVTAQSGRAQGSKYWEGQIECEKSMTLRWGNAIFFRLARLRLRPLKGFLSWHDALQGHRLASCLASGTTEKQGLCRARCGGPRTRQD